MGHHVTPKGIWEVLKASFKGFGEDKVPKLSASLAYYTVFSLGPLLIMLIYLCSIFLGREAIEGSIYNQIDGFVGREAADQIQGIIKNVALEGKGGLAFIIGIITLLIGATTVFAEIQDSINSIWGLKAKPKLGIMKLLKDRLLSFGIIGSFGFLLLVSLGISAIIDALGNRLKDTFPDVTVVIFYIINLLLTLIVTTGLFAVIFKVLPDAKIKWKDVLGGALATSILFMIGKLLISLYISKSEVGSAYGAAGALVILIVWIYYSAIILYFGAEFTKAYALKYGAEIHPSKFAITVKKVEVEGGEKSVQQMDNVNENNMHANQHPSHIDRNAKKQYLPKPQFQYESERPALGMFDLVQALAVAALMKLSDFGKEDKTT
ncbi:MAG TPA: YihY/virulence factor BrkB family protein [Chitinophagaceae bacterium]|nr:YihY/virulence factor BrkB family protein [Chitinophagaceae bacterium]